MILEQLVTHKEFFCSLWCTQNLPAYCPVRPWPLHQELTYVHAHSSSIMTLEWAYLDVSMLRLVHKYAVMPC